MKIRIPQVFLPLSVVIITLSVPSASGQRESNVHTIERIADAFARRRQGVENFRVEGTQMEVEFAANGGAVSEMNRDFVMLMSGDSERFDMIGDIPQRGPGIPEGSTAMTQNEEANHEGEHRNYSPMKGRGLVEVGYERIFYYDDIRAIRMALGGPLDRGYRQTTGELEVFDVRTGPDDRQIVVVGNTDYLDFYSMGTTGSLPRVEYQLDPSRDYLLLGYELYSMEGLLSATIELEYRTDPEYGDVPSAVTVTRIHPETQVPHSVMQTTIHTVGINTRVDEWEFIIDFPEGTRLWDGYIGKRYTVGEPTPTPDPTPGARPALTPRTPRPPTAIQIEAVAAEARRQSSASNFIRIGFGLTLFITGIALIALYRSMRK